MKAAQQTVEMDRPSEPTLPSPTRAFPHASSLSSSPRIRAQTAASTTTVEAKRRAIREHPAALANKDHYAVLGVPKDATSAEIQSAYFTSAKLFHPDTLTNETADLREQTTQIFGAIAEAHRILFDPTRRAAYDAERVNMPQGGKGEADELERVLEAANTHQKAEILLRANDLAEAERLAARACELDPSRPEHLALYGWLLAMKRDPTAVDRGLDLLDRSIVINPDVDRTHYWRGAILKRLRRTNDAMRDFRRAAELNPRNVEAVREVRLHHMRVGSGADKGGGVLSRFFKGMKK